MRTVFCGIAKIGFNRVQLSLDVQSLNVRFAEMGSAQASEELEEVGDALDPE
jgi:hypothetical protein